MRNGGQLCYGTTQPQPAQGGPLALPEHGIISIARDEIRLSFWTCEGNGAVRQWKFVVRFRCALRTSARSHCGVWGPHAQWEARAEEVQAILGTWEDVGAEISFHAWEFLPAFEASQKGQSKFNYTGLFVTIARTSSSGHITSLLNHLKVLADSKFEVPYPSTTFSCQYPSYLFCNLLPAPTYSSQDYSSRQIPHQYPYTPI